jgi:hypothetical protein
MKKILFLSLITLFFFACNESNTGNNKKDKVNKTEEQTKTASKSSKIQYPFKSGIVKYENKAMGRKTNLTLYFKDYGKLECSVSKINIGEQSMTIRSLIKDGYLYSIADAQKNGTKMKVDDSYSTYIIDPELFKKKLSEINGKKLGTEKILGRTCQVYSMNENGAESKMWIWKNMMLKMSANQNGLSMTMEAKSIEETDKFPKGVFNVPSTYTITEEPDMDMDVDDFDSENAAG